MKLFGRQVECDFIYILLLLFFVKLQNEEEFNFQNQIFG